MRLHVAEVLHPLYLLKEKLPSDIKWRCEVGYQVHEPEVGGAGARYRFESHDPWMVVKTVP